MHEHVKLNRVEACLLPSLNALNEKAKRVEPWKQDSSDHLVDSVLREAKVLCPHNRRVYQVQAEGVCSAVAQHVHRIGVIFQTFRHFLPIGCIDYSIDDQILEGRFVKEAGRYYLENKAGRCRAIQDGTKR